MLSEKLGQILLRARKLQQLSQQELADRAGVSTRMVAELERGERPNVGLESALKLLAQLGVSVMATAPDGAVAMVRDAGSDALQRAARAAVRRRTWTGVQVKSQRAGHEPAAGASAPKRLAAVAMISKQTFSVGRQASVRPDSERRSWTERRRSS